MKIKHTRTIVIGFLLTGLWGCNKEAQNPLCSEHENTHQEHITDVAKVNVVYTGQGDISTTILFPDTLSGDARFSQAESLLSLQTTKTCKADIPLVSKENDRVKITLNYTCESDNVLEKANVLLFEHYPQLQELEVHVSTPAVDKHFVLNKQCDRPIFKFTKE